MHTDPYVPQLWSIFIIILLVFICYSNSCTQLCATQLGGQCNILVASFTGLSVACSTAWEQGYDVSIMTTVPIIHRYNNYYAVVTRLFLSYYLYSLAMIFPSTYVRHF